MRSTLISLGLVASAALDLFSVGAQANCTANPPTQPNSTFPANLTGKLAYHSYISHGDGTSQIFIYDFSVRTLQQVSKAAWGTQDPMNVVFSPDGRWIAFVDITNNVWDVFLQQVGSTSMPINLANSTGQARNEDPKFSTDGKSLFFGQNNDVIQAALSYTNSDPVLTSTMNLTRTAPMPESPMPFATPDGTAAFYTMGTGSGMGLYKQTVDSTTKVAFDTPASLATYYPIVRTDGTMFYARWHDATNQADQIYTEVDPSDTPNQLTLNDCDSSSSDPSPVDNTSYVFFSSTSAGDYQLYLSSASTGQRWNLSQFGMSSDTTKARLGSNCYTGTPAVAAKAATLLSQGKPISTSSNYGASLDPAYTFDGNTTSTRWGSVEGVAGAQWLITDLGTTCTITGVDLYWDAGVKVCSIQASNDGVGWANIYSTSSGASWGHTSLTNFKDSGRYVRMYGMQRATQWNYSLDEMQVWGY